MPSSFSIGSINWVRRQYLNHTTEKDEKMWDTSIESFTQRMLNARHRVNTMIKQRESGNPALRRGLEWTPRPTGAAQDTRWVGILPAVRNAETMDKMYFLAKLESAQLNCSDYVVSHELNHLVSSITKSLTPEELSLYYQRKFCFAWHNVVELGNSKFIMENKHLTDPVFWSARSDVTVEFMCEMSGKKIDDPRRIVAYIDDPIPFSTDQSKDLRDIAGSAPRIKKADIAAAYNNIDINSYTEDWGVSSFFNIPIGSHVSRHDRQGRQTATANALGVRKVSLRGNVFNLTNSYAFSALTTAEARKGFEDFIANNQVFDRLGNKIDGLLDGMAHNSDYMHGWGFYYNTDRGVYYNTYAGQDYNQYILGEGWSTDTDAYDLEEVDTWPEGVVHTENDSIFKRIVPIYGPGADVVGICGQGFLKAEGERPSKYNGNILYMGLELEVETDSGDWENAEHLSSTMMHDMDNNVVCVEDGSLDCGFEIVTIPATRQYHRDVIWQKFQHSSVRYAIGSWDYDSTGIHIHMSKNCFTDLTLGKFIAFVNSIANRDFMGTVAQRMDNSYANYYGSYTDPAIMRKSGECRFDSLFDKYNAVNVGKSATVEVRIFKGTCNVNSILKNLDFCEALLEFVNKASYRDLNFKEFCRFLMRPANRKRYKYLFNFLRDKKVLQKIAKDGLEERAMRVLVHKDKTARLTGEEIDRIKAVEKLPRTGTNGPIFD